MATPMPGSGGSAPLKMPGIILRAVVANTTIMTQTPPVATVMATTLTAVGSIIWALLYNSFTFWRRWNTFLKRVWNITLLYAIE